MKQNKKDTRKQFEGIVKELENNLKQLQEEYKKYTDIAGPAIIASGAKILCRGGKIINLEGQKFGRIVIIFGVGMILIDKKKKLHEQ